MEAKKSQEFIRFVKNRVSNMLIIQNQSRKNCFRPVKNTSKQQIYKFILELQAMLDIPHSVSKSYVFVEVEEVK